MTTENQAPTNIQLAPPISALASEDVKLLSPLPLVSRLKLSLAHPIAFGADIVGVLGIPAIILQVAEYFKVVAVLSIRIKFWACAGFVPFAVIFVGTCWHWFFDMKNRGDSLAKRLQLREEAHAAALQQAYDRYVDSLAKTQTVKIREDQRHAMIAMKNVFGFHLKLRRHHYTIHADGHGSISHKMVFVCNRRSLKTWSRRVLSSMAEIKVGCKEPKISPANFKVQNSYKATTRGTEQGIIETFTFSPTLQQKDDDVTLTFKDDIPKGAFIFEKNGARPGLTFDYIGTSPREPIEELQIEVLFVDVNVGEISSEVIYGPDNQTLGAEDFAVAETHLESDGKSGNVTAKLFVKNPIMGAAYRIRWTLMEPQTTTPGAIAPGV